MMFKRTIRRAGLVGLLLVSQVTTAANSEPSKPILLSADSIKTETRQQTYSVIKLHSDILKEDRELWVSLPEDYAKSDKKFPVLYLLDGTRHFPHALNAESILQEESLIPQSIIVAIPNKRGTRTRDLSGQKEKFLSFIKNEVMGLIINHYRVSNQTTIFGHSMAGYFVLNVLATEPELFNNYIAASPVIQVNNSELLNKYESLPISPEAEKKSLYLTLTSQAHEGVAATDALNQFVELMKRKAPKVLNWHYEYIPNQVHMTTPYLTLYEGLAHVFSDFQMPVYSGLQDYNKRGGYEGLKDYYAKRSNKYQTSTEIPERVIRRLGFALIDDGHAEEAVKLLEPIVEKSPESIRALNVLAEAYESSQPEKAIETYRKALALAKNRSPGAASYIESQITRLQGESDKS